MQCPKCGHVNQSGSSFCGNCGVIFDLQQPSRETKQIAEQPFSEAAKPDPLVSPDTKPRAKQFMAGVAPLRQSSVTLPIVVVLLSIAVIALLVGLGARKARLWRKPADLARVEMTIEELQSRVLESSEVNRSVEAGSEQAIEKPIEPQYVRIEPGTFMMGSPEAELRHFGDETQHRVTLTRAFEMSATEVTQGQYEALMGRNPSKFEDCGKNCPVENVSWHDAVTYCNKLSEQAGLSTCYKCNDGKCKAKPGNIYACKGYRLPTEAEWEYAARAGTTTAFYSGAVQRDGLGEEPALDRIGWYVNNTKLGPRAVKGKAPNAWGPYDMSGNVSEWCHDWYEFYSTVPVTNPSGPAAGALRVIRGGGSMSYAGHFRSARRAQFFPDMRSGLWGFRPVRSLFVR